VLGLGVVGRVRAQERVDAQRHFGGDEGHGAAVFLHRGVEVLVLGRDGGGVDVRGGQR